MKFILSNEIIFQFSNNVFDERHGDLILWMPVLNQLCWSGAIPTKAQ